MSTLKHNVKINQAVKMLLRELQGSLGRAYRSERVDYKWHKVIYQPFVSDYVRLKRTEDPTFSLTDAQEVHIGDLIDRVQDDYMNFRSDNVEYGLDEDLQRLWDIVSPYHELVCYTPEVLHVGRGGKHCVLTEFTYNQKHNTSNTTQSVSTRVDEINYIVDGCVNSDTDIESLIFMVQVARNYTQEECYTYFAHEIDYSLGEDGYPVEGNEDNDNDTEES